MRIVGLLTVVSRLGLDRGIVILGTSVFLSRSAGTALAVSAKAATLTVVSVSAKAAALTIITVSAKTTALILPALSPEKLSCG